jgi:hypothetical protein
MCGAGGDFPLLNLLTTGRVRKTKIRPRSNIYCPKACVLKIKFFPIPPFHTIRQKIRSAFLFFRGLFIVGA